MRSFKTVPSGGGGGGCPFVYTWNGEVWVKDNNILPQSEYIEDGFITDHYQLFKEPVDSRGRYHLRIGEFEEEVSVLDKISLQLVDHLPEAIVYVNENGEISQYAKPASLSNAQLGREDVIKLVSGLDGDIVEVQKDETLQLNFEEQQDGMEMGILLVARPIEPRDEKKFFAASIEQKHNGKLLSVQPFRLRRNPSYTLLPISGANSKDNDLQIDILWQKKAEIDYTELSHKIALDYTSQFAELLSAEHSQNGNITSLLQSSDNNLAILNPGGWIDLEFMAPPVPEGMKRSFILISNGRYDKVGLKDSRLLTQKVKSMTNESVPNNYEFNNHPNPFNPTTTISYALPEPGFVSIKAYDLLGREVVTLVNSYQESGYRTLEFDASNLPSGIYICRMQAGKFTAVKKIVFMR